MISRNILILLSILVLLTQTGCQALKPKKVSAKDFPPDPRERVKKNVEEGRGFRLMGGSNSGTNYEFASSNPLWRATLDTLDFMSLVSANYSGGIVITDWYSENDSPNEAVKISVRFLTNEIQSNSVKVTVHKKFCKTQGSCTTKLITSKISEELTKSILVKAAELEAIDKKKKN